MMKMRTTLLVLFALSLIASVAGSATAKEVPIKGHNKDMVEGKCNGVFWPSGGTSATYGCLNKDGSGIVCGGKTAEQKKTCSTFRAAPKGSYRRQLAVALSRAKR